MPSRLSIHPVGLVAARSNTRLETALAAQTASVGSRLVVRPRGPLEASRVPPSTRGLPAFLPGTRRAASGSGSDRDSLLAMSDRHGGSRERP